MHDMHSPGQAELKFMTPVCIVSEHVIYQTRSLKAERRDEGNLGMYMWGWNTWVDDVGLPRKGWGGLSLSLS